MNNGGYMFKVKKKDEIGSPLWRVFQIMPMPTQFGSISFQLLAYNETAKVFDLIDAKDYEIVDEVSKSSLL